MFEIKGREVSLLKSRWGAQKNKNKTKEKDMKTKRKSTITKK